MAGWSSIGDGPVGYSADVINGELVVRFDRPIKGDFRSLVRPMGRYLRSVSVSADRETATFPLTHPVQVKAFVGNNNAVVIDLLDKADEASSPEPPQPAPTASMVPAAEPPADGPTSLLPQSRPGGPPPPSPTPPAARPRAESNEPASVEVRDGEHGSYNRLVFGWPRAVDYKVEKQGNRATISFAKPARFDMAGVQSGLPPDMAVISAEGGPKTATVVLTVPANARLRHFASGSKVVLDVVRDAAGPVPAAAKAAPADGEVSLPALKPLAAEAAPSLPSESVAAALTAAPSLAKATPEPKAPPAKAGAGKGREAEPPPPSAAARPAVTASPPPSPSPSSDTDKVFSLSVAWEKPVAAAVFRRAGYLWLVFDRKQEVDTKLLRRLGGEAVTAVEQVANREATVLRLVVQPDYVPSVRRDGLLWVIDLMAQPAEPKDPIPVTAPASLPTGIGISLNVAEAGTLVSVSDPEVGDSMLVVPVITLGAGVYPGPRHA